MADKNNPGQFGNRNDTEDQAQKGGQASSGSFGERNAADPSQAGQQGGQESSGSFGQSNAADPSQAGQKGGDCVRAASVSRMPGSELVARPQGWSGEFAASARKCRGRRKGQSS